MDNNTIPPLQDDTAFLQLPFTQPVIPYNDLHVTGTPERTLLLQDDLPMTMSVLTAKGTLQQRLVTQNDDGGVNVHVVNQSGGGGGSITPVAMNQGPSQQGLLSVAAGSNPALVNFNPGSNLMTLYGFTYGFSLSAVPGAGNFGRFEMFLGRQDIPAPKPILVLVMVQYMGSGAGVDIPPNGWSDTVMFPIPIDIATTFGTNNVKQCLSVNSDFAGRLSLALFGGWV